MLRKNDVRGLWESMGSEAERPARFHRRMRFLMGLSDEDGNPFRQPVAGHAIVKDKVQERGGPLLERLRLGEVSIGQLGRGMLGDDVFEEFFNPESHRLAGMRPVFEAGEGAIQASAFANINAFTGVVAGLLEVAILEAWKNPLFIGDKLMSDEPSRQFEGRKTIGVGRIGDQAEERLPGMPTKRVQIGERWITQPRTIEDALACELTQEMVFLDLSGQALAETSGASGVGEWLGYHEEIRKIDCFIGVTTAPQYNYKGNTYNTFLTGGFYTNDYSGAGFELLHEADVESALVAFRDMTDPETGTRVLINPNAVVVQREKVRTARGLVGDLAFGFQYRDNPVASSPQVINQSAPAYAGQFEVIESPLIYERITAANGLNKSASDAAKMWWMLEKGRAFVNVVNWPMRVQQAAPGQLEMIDRGIVQYVKADVRSTPMVREPRKVIRRRVS